MCDVGTVSGNVVATDATLLPGSVPPTAGVGSADDSAAPVSSAETGRLDSEPPADGMLERLLGAEDDPDLAGAGDEPATASDDDDDDAAAAALAAMAATSLTLEDGRAALQDCLCADARFYDVDFDVADASRAGKMPTGTSVRRFGDTVPADSSMFGSEPSPDDIVEGLLGDCFFLAAVRYGCGEHCAAW